MTDERFSNDPLFTAYAFFAGASFTALFFVLQTKPQFFLFDFLISMMSIGSILLFLATLGRVNITTGKIQRDTTYSKVVSWFAVIGVGLLLVSIGLAIFPFSLLGGIIVLITALVSLGILNTLATREFEKQKRNTKDHQS